MVNAEYREKRTRFWEGHRGKELFVCDDTEEQNSFVGRNPQKSELNKFTMELRGEQEPRSRYSLCGVRMENIQVKSFYKEYLYCIKSFKLK